MASIFHAYLSDITEVRGQPIYVIIIINFAGRMAPHIMKCILSCRVKLRSQLLFFFYTRSKGLLVFSQLLLVRYCFPSIIGRALYKSMECL
jgi:hypothetical protein